MYKPESVLQNEVHKILKKFEIQTDQLIPTRRPGLISINNIPADQKVKIMKTKS